nr:unnamed protein product [Callosobruchus analis]
MVHAQLGGLTLKDSQDLLEAKPVLDLLCSYRLMERTKRTNPTNRSIEHQFPQNPLELHCTDCQECDTEPLKTFSPQISTTFLVEQHHMKNMPGCAAVHCSNSSEKGFLMKRFQRDPDRRK